MPLVCHPETLGLSAVSAVPGMKPLVTGAMLSGDGRVRRIVRMIEIKKGGRREQEKGSKVTCRVFGIERRDAGSIKKNAIPEASGS